MPEKNRTAKGVLGGLLGLIGLSTVAGLLVTATVTPALAVTGAAGSQAISLFDNLPSYLEVNAPMEPTNFFATGTDGNPVQIASFYDQNRTPVTFNQVSPIMYDAILSSEDKSYYEHGGINLGSTLKAVVDNLRGTSSRGASTISQQYVKNVLVQQCEQEILPGEEDYQERLTACWTDATNAVGSEGVQRKLEEMRYAIQIEKEYSKNDILLGYLNIANFGGQVYGIEAAARYYFNTSAANVTISQAATLAGMVQNPNTYRIDRPEGSTTNSAGELINSAADGYAETLVRRNYVLERLLADGKITQTEYDTAYAEPITPNINQPIQGCEAAGTSAYFCQYVKYTILSDPAFGATPEERQQTLQRKGLDVYTSLDLRIQEPAVEALQSRVPPSIDDAYLGAAGVSVETKTGRIVAMTQNTIFQETQTEDQSRTGLVFAADKAHGGSNGFPVGSTYKLFTLIDWLEKGHSLNQGVDGRDRVMQFDTCDGDFVSADTRQVGNFGGTRGYAGTPMQFTAASLNSGFFAMASQLELCDINGVADRLGVSVADGTKTTDTNFPYDVLGSKFIAPLDMAGAYAAVANNGTYCTPRAIDRVVDQSGNDLTLPESSCTEVLAPEIAATAAYALAGVMNGGTGGAARAGDGVPTIGKTGTHQTYSTMMIQSSTEIATAVWVGRSTGTRPIRGLSGPRGSLVEMRYGISAEMQRAANAIYGGDRFPAPSQNLIRRVYVTLPSVVGLSIDEARQRLEAAGFGVTVGDAVTSSQPEGLVATQSPGAGQVAPGTNVVLSPSSGGGLTVPTVSGSQGDAIRALQAAGFTTVQTHPSCRANDATVTGTDPAAGSEATASTTITMLCN